MTALVSPDTPFDVILYNEDREVMETTIANIAVETENEETGELEWITPPASSGRLSFLVIIAVGTKIQVALICSDQSGLALGLLRGTMRRKLLESGEIREGVVTLNDLKKAVMVCNPP